MNSSDMNYNLAKTPDNSAVYYPYDPEEEVLSPYMGMVTFDSSLGQPGSHA